MAMHDPTTTSRRSLLKAGSVGVFAAAFLAACSDDHPVGVSGKPAPVTEVPPTVPTKDPTEAELAEVQAQLRTLASVELLVADVYQAQGSRVTDARLAPVVGRGAAEHRAAAQRLIGLTDDGEDPGANEYLQAELVEPAEHSLVTEDNVRVFLRNLESSLTATYVTAVETMVDPSVAQTLMTHGGATARRVTALSDGVVPSGAFFPPKDLIANDAYLRDAEGEEPAEGEDAEGDDAAE